LDEISETSPAFQSKLLRVLQESVFERVGGEQSIKVNVRVIAAANKDLTRAIEVNKFRSDLYYRLNGFTITLPPLRDRTGDIPLLARHFLDLYDYKSIREISTRVIETLKNYQWPGNIRELDNVIRRAAILAQSDSRPIIQLKDLPEEILTYKNFSIPGQIHKPLEEQILNMLRAYRFSHSAITQTAKTLGNKDRGTITEYLRGICFEYYVKNQFNLNNASKEISASSDNEIIDRVKNKMAQYLKNVEEAGKDQNKLKSCYKGLPQKYHPFLDEIIHSKN
jgi:transcriptional regulator with GAF, ATPase, and Fis domain